MATRIGCDSLYYAIMTTEDTPLVAPVFGTPVSLPGVIAVNINPNVTQDTLFADDGPFETAVTLGKIEVEVNKNELATAERAALLGHSIDTKGAVVYGDSDVPPYVAIGFRTLKSNGNYRYIWLYKGRFTDPEENNDTKGDGINFQTDVIKGQFVKLSYGYTVDGKVRRPWKYEIDEDYGSADAATITSWFTAVTMPDTAVAAPALTLTVTAGTTTGTTKVAVTEALGGGNNYAYKLAASAITVPANGTVVYGETDYTENAEIAVTEGQFVQIYELTATDSIVGFAQHEVLLAEIG